VPEDHLWLVSLWPPHVSVSGPLPRARERALLGMASLRCGAYRVFTRKRAILVSSVKILRTRLDGVERAISPTTICAAVERVVRFVNFISSETSRGAEHGHSLPSARWPLACALHVVATSASCAGDLPVNDHVAHAVGIGNLPAVSSLCSWPTTATHAVTRSILIDDWIMETLGLHCDWLRVALDS